MSRVAHIMPPEKTDEFILGLFTAHGAALRRHLARLLGSESEAADIAQDTYLKLLRLGRPGKLLSARAWLFSAATRLAFDHLRRRKDSAIVPLALETDRLMDESPTLENRAIAQDALHRLEDILQELPPRRREVYVMLQFQGLTRKEIAAALAITVSMVDQHLRRANVYCRKRLRELDLD